MIIAIDGPAGSGKTTVARLLSKKLAIGYLDTGAMYRALTLKALESGVPLTDEEALRKLAENLDLMIKGDNVILDGQDVKNKIRTPTIDKNISVVVAYPKVREVMVDLQRKIAKGKKFVVEGRDITTVVFPKAKYKFFLDADANIRATRRFKELQDKGISCDFKEINSDLNRRDDADINRAVGALKLDPKAIKIDTTNFTIDEVINKMLEYIKK